MFFRKFYDVDAPAEAAPSLASLMAKEGKLTTGNQDDGPIHTTERKEAPPAPATPAPATDAPNAAKATPATPLQKKEDTPAPPQTAAPAPPPTLQEVLKQHQPKAILKELGFDERLADLHEMDPKIWGLLNHWKSKGDIKPYLQALDTDFQKMSPEEVMRYQLRTQYPELDAKQLDTLYKIKVTQRYKLDPQLYSEDEAAEGQVELLADVKPIREALSKQQQEYLMPPPPEPKAAVSEADLLKQQQQQGLEVYKSQINEANFTKDLQKNKYLTIGEGDEQYKWPVDPETVLDLLYDNEKWTRSHFTVVNEPDGSVSYVPDVEKQIMVAAFLNDPKGFIRDIGKHFKSLGAKSVNDLLENARPADAGTPATADKTPANPAAAAARQGRFVRGGE